MPIHEFECKKCNHRFERLILSGDDPSPECPKCKNKKADRLISAGSFRAHGIPTGAGGFTPPACGPSRG